MSPFFSLICKVREDNLWLQRYEKDCNSRKKLSFLVYHEKQQIAVCYNFIYKINLSLSSELIYEL